jgi:HD-GYP domain-containing protein (c-di-GMP phosphodiesterase class II)
MTQRPEIIPTSKSHGYSPGETVRDRCRALGLASWLADTAGTLIDEPGDSGLAGLWLRSGFVRDMVAQSAHAWSDEPRPALREPVPQFWLLPIPQEQRRRRIGMTIALAAGPNLLTSRFFTEACRSAGLEESSAKVAMRRLATFDESSAQRTAATLQWMAQDLVQLNEYQDAVTGFTSELTDSYETIDLLYGLGRSMLDLDRPERFVQLLCDRLFETMPFAWVAARFEDLDVPSILVRGRVPRSPEQLVAFIDALRLRLSQEQHGFLLDGSEATAAGDSLGASKVLVQPVMRGTQVAGILLVGEKNGEDPQISSYDIQLLEAAAAFTGAFLENTQLYRDHQAMFVGSLKALTAAIDAKDRYTCGHSERVALLASRLAAAAGLGETYAGRIHICGLLHDVGKIGVPEAVLSKPGKLTEQEFGLVRLHPEIGFRILKDIPQLADILPGVLHHHERWDGDGYPHNLRGEQIPLPARILGLADTFDAMSSNRSYRAAVPRDAVLAEIRRLAGAQFDPALANTFLSLDLREYDALVARHAAQVGATVLEIAA